MTVFVCNKHGFWSSDHTIIHILKSVYGECIGGIRVKQCFLTARVTTSHHLLPIPSSVALCYGITLPPSHTTHSGSLLWHHTASSPYHPSWLPYTPCTISPYAPSMTSPYTTYTSPHYKILLLTPIHMLTPHSYNFAI